MLHPRALRPFGWTNTVCFFLSLSVYLTWFRESMLSSLGLILQCGAENSCFTRPTQDHFIKHVWADLKPALPPPLSQNKASVGVAAGFKIPQEAAYRTRHGVSLCQSPHALKNMWYAALRWAIKDSPTDKVWGAYGRGGAHSWVRNACTYVDKNVQEISHLRFLEKLVHREQPKKVWEYLHCCCCC